MLMELIDMLLEARNRLADPDKWIKGSVMHPELDKTCAIGSVQVATGELIYRGCRTLEHPWMSAWIYKNSEAVNNSLVPIAQRVVRALDIVATELYKRAIYSVNDSISREAALNVFDITIRRVKDGELEL
jgi:hypothetical protein